MSPSGAVISDHIYIGCQSNDISVCKIEVLSECSGQEPAATVFLILSSYMLIVSS